MTEITSEAALDSLYDALVPTSILKEVDYITDDYKKLIDASPFAILATSGPEGLDCSPRGDPSGFVRVAEPKTLMIPDRRGNNRIDSLRNIVRDPRVALLFLIPGIETPMGVNGRAKLTADPELCADFTMESWGRAGAVQDATAAKTPNALSSSRWSGPTHSARRPLSARSCGTLERTLPNPNYRALAKLWDAWRKAILTEKPMTRSIQNA